MMYEYRATVLNVVDGDTIDCQVQLGFGIVANFRFRLSGVDAPESYGPKATPEGQAAKLFTRAWLDARKGHLVVRTQKASVETVGIGDGAYGRWLASFLDDRDAASLADALIAAGYDTGRRW
jgi:micrococcal nuclease